MGLENKVYMNSTTKANATTTWYVRDASGNLLSYQPGILFTSDYYAG